MHFIAKIILAFVTFLAFQASAMADVSGSDIGFCAVGNKVMVAKAQQRTVFGKDAKVSGWYYYDDECVRIVKNVGDYSRVWLNIFVDVGGGKYVELTPANTEFEGEKKYYRRSRGPLSLEYGRSEVTTNYYCVSVKSFDNYQAVKRVNKRPCGANEREARFPYYAVVFDQNHHLTFSVFWVNESSPKEPPRFKITVSGYY